MEPRRFFLSRLAGLPLLAMVAADGVQALPGIFTMIGKALKKTHG